MALPTKKLKLCFASLVFASSANQALAANWQPHRAVYDLVSTQISKDQNFSKVDGRFAYEITGSSCDGWSISYRFLTRYDNTQGPQTTFDSQSSSWENDQGSEFRLNYKSFADGKIAREIKVDVARDVGSKKLIGKLKGESPKDFDLPLETVFPLYHQNNIIKAAQQGTTIDTQTIYDGVEDDKAMRLVTFIGKSKDVAGPASTKDADVKFSKAVEGVKAYPLTMSYFNLGQGDNGQPIYQSSFKLYENGLVQSIEMDYLSYKLQASLFSFESLPVEKCK